MSEQNQNSSDQPGVQSVEPPAAGTNIVGDLPPASMQKPTPPPPPPEPHYDPRTGHLTLKAARQRIAAGGSVIFGGRIYSRVEDLPTEEQLSAHRDRQVRDLAVENERIAAQARAMGQSMGQAIVEELRKQPAGIAAKPGQPSLRK